jgi:integrase
MSSKSISCKIDQRAIEKYAKLQSQLGERVTLSDTVCSGLKLVINNQSASWTYAYRKRGYAEGGKRHPQRTLKVGDPTTLSPAEARLRVDQVKALVREGGDPAVEQRRAQAEQRADEARRKTLRQWVDRYAAAEMKDGASKYQRDEIRNIRFGLDEIDKLDVFPSDLSAKDVRSLIALHEDRPATARQRFGAMSRFLDYLLDEEVIAINPASSVSKKRRPKPPQHRSNFYTFEQLRRLWHAEGLKTEYQRYLRFMITSPLRAKEGANLRWEHVDLNRAEIRLGSEDTKNSEAFIMPLNGMALDVIGEAGDDTALVFPLSRRTGGQMKSWSHFNTKVRETSGVQEFILHDLRRTFSTLMAENTDVSETLIDGLLNHKQAATRSGVIRHYQQAKHVEQRRHVMAEWANLLDGWV